MDVSAVIRWPDGAAVKGIHLSSGEEAGWMGSNGITECPLLQSFDRVFKPGGVRRIQADGAADARASVSLG